MNPEYRGKLPALFFACVLAAPALSFAADPVVVVSASRFDETDPRIAANIGIIDRADIDNSPAHDLPGLLKTQAGVDVRSLYGSHGIDATVDLRGFGDGAGSNTLILLDGLRLNPIDFSAVSWSAIPLASVRRVEIIRGAGTVLYGDRASGGVINIITDKSGASSASATATLGSDHFRGLDAYLSGGAGDLRGQLALHHAAGDGWRANNRLEQWSLSGRSALALPAGEAFVDAAVYRDQTGLPGYLATAAYHARPRSSRTPDDRQERDGFRLRPGVALKIGESLRFEAEASVQQEESRSRYVSFASDGERDSRNWSLTPRLLWRHGLGTLPSETVAGIDYYVGEVDSVFTTSPAQGARQTSRALYVQNRTELDRWTLTLGQRHQRMTQDIYQRAWPAWFQPAFEGGATRTRNAGDVSLAWSDKGWRAWGKVGTTFRFANTDELFAWDPFTGSPVFAGQLRPQHGTVRELGGSVSYKTMSARLSAYRMDLTDEIGYDGAAFANVNFDPTRRQGAEADIDWRFAEGLRARLAWAYTDARFRSGAYSGKAIPLVARDRGTLQLDWSAGRPGRYTAVLNYTGDRPYSGDFSRVRPRLAGFVTLDLRAAWEFRPLTLAVRVLNATDRRYASFAGYSASLGDEYYYPADGRTVFVSVRYDMK